MTYTAEEKYLEATRELQMRLKVYGAVIERGDMTREVADRRVRIMRAIAADYEQLAVKERLL